MKNFTIQTRHNLTFIVCDPLTELGFVNAFSTRLSGDAAQQNEFTLGNFNDDQKVRVLANRRQFQAALGCESFTLVTAKQIHSDFIRSIKDENDAKAEPQEGDALTVNSPKILLGIQTADCLPILIADPKTKAFAAIHAGWRGTFANIAALTVERMQREYGSHPGDLHAALGPAICAENFEVGPEVLEQFTTKFSYAKNLISKIQPSGKGHFDLNACNVQQLIEAGLQAEKIYDSALCTVNRNDLFFSYRKERGHERYTGRLMSAVGIKMVVSGR